MNGKSVTSNKYYSISIPNNVEIYIFTKISTSLSCAKSDFEHLCGFTKKKRDGVIVTINTNPLYKYTHPSKFPNLYFTADIKRKMFNGGIEYCRKPEENQRIIYSLDANPDKSCRCDSIDKKNDGHIYDCEKNFSPFYNNKIKENARTCGPIFLSDAIDLIQQHYNGIPPKEKNINTKIKIFIAACLVTENLDRIIQSPYIQSNVNKEKFLKNFVYEISDYKHTTLDPIYEKPQTKTIHVIENNVNYNILNIPDNIYHNKYDIQRKLTTIARKYINTIISNNNILQTNIPPNVNIDISSLGDDLDSNIILEYNIGKTSNDFLKYKDKPIYILMQTQIKEQIKK